MSLEPPTEVQNGHILVWHKHHDVAGHLEATVRIEPAAALVIGQAVSAAGLAETAAKLSASFADSALAVGEILPAVAAVLAAGLAVGMWLLKYSRGGMTWDTHYLGLTAMGCGKRMWGWALCIFLLLPRSNITF